MKKKLKLMMVTLGCVCAMGITSLAGNWVGDAWTMRFTMERQ